MDIHKPKPWHGLREFLKEYAIIVVGVLTALGAEQGVEWLHWRHLAEQARADMAADYRRTLKNVGQLDAAAPCERRRVDELRAALDKAEVDGRLPALPAIDPPPNFAWTFRGWEGLVSSQALAHLPRGEAARYSAQAAYVTYLIRMRDAQRDDWAILSSMGGPSRPMSAAEAANLRATLGRVLSEDGWLRTQGDGLGRMISDTGLLSRSEVERWWKEGLDALAKGRNTICRPLAEAGVRSWVADNQSAPPEPPTKPFETTDYYSPRN
jgi:hypothetical protein